ncbi:MAG TPA: Stk1 family PASTA domain-containing Ser/Thr kinase [Frankiaceae bacterium]|jgi:serine/threonine-protein kinase|nr:Stk1 family PASTA domain-containing Ser/Thr kinase [Frankiaceae bacterium]
MRTALNQSVDPLLGRLLDGRYEISGRLAQGGMAVVYSAFDTRLDRAVAVKIMHPALAADEEFVGRFRREAKAAARLSNPHVVAVTDQGQDGDVIFLVMELVEGHTLREVLREAGRLDEVSALQFMVPVLEALAAAHRAGLVHRDVKPENVLVANDGTVKVGDFGLARAVDASPLTATAGLLLGTVAYLAPEQVARGVADARADVYACGVMLFELLTGAPPFQGASALQVAYQHLNDDVPPPSTLVAGVSPAVDRLVGAATARDPADRPHDATAMLFRTRAVLERLAPAAAAPSRNDTAPLALDLAEAAALDLARNGKRASSRTAETPVAPRDAPEAESDLDDDPGLDGWLRGAPADTGAFVDLTAGSAGSHGTGELDLDADPADTDDDPPGRRRRLRRRTKNADRPARRRFLRPSRIILLLLVLATAAAGVVGWRLAGRGASVPSVIGSSQTAAETSLRKAHLSPQVGPVEVYSETVKKGDVATVSPSAGHHVKRGALVTLQLSLGPERYSVPTVDKLTLADAVDALKVAHLHADTPTTAYSDTVAKGAVISISPTAGNQVKPQTHVAIVVSNGPAPVTIPKLTGLTGDQATKALQKLDLKVNVTNDFSDTVAIGQVIGITPAKGLHRTQTVHLSVSKGPQMVTIPYGIENDSPGYAKQVLQSLGLVVQTHSYFPGLDSSILTVRPGGGSYVRVGSQVSIYLY